MGDIKLNPILVDAFRKKLQQQLGPLSQRQPLEQQIPEIPAEETDEEKHLRMLKQLALQRMMGQQNSGQQ